MTSKFSSIPLRSDNPISSPEDDVLEWTSVAETFARRTLNFDIAHGLVVGVFGPWGSGKTSFINLARPEFQRANVPVLDFNPWLFSGADQLVGRFFAELSAAMGQSSSLEQIACFLRGYGDLVSPAITTISGLAGTPLPGGASNLVSKFLKKGTEAPISAIASRNKLTEALAERTSPIVVILDDVDRLPVSEIREIFKLVRLTASFPNLIYVIACDRIRVEAALDEEGIGTRGNYLEKIFQWSINVPTASRERLREEFLDGTRKALGRFDPPFSHEDWPDIEAEIILPLLRNMRDVRRYSLAIRGTVADLGTMVALVDVLALEAIRLFLPILFSKLPQLVSDLTVLPVSESNQLRSEEIISEQMGDMEKVGEASRTRLDELLETVDREHRTVARAMIHRLFRGGRSEHEEQDQDWPALQLRNDRVVHGTILRLYLTRVADSDLTASSNAKRVFECLHDQDALRDAMESIDPEAWPKCILSLWGMFHSDFSIRHSEPGLVVFWNLLPDMPRGTSTFADEPLTVTRAISASLLAPLVGAEDLVQKLKGILNQVQSLSSKVALISQIKKLEFTNSTCLSKLELDTLEELTNNEILSVDADLLAEERHPAQILMFSSKRANPPATPLVVHDSAKLTFALLWDCQTRSASMELGSRTAETRRGLHASTLVSIHGNVETLLARLNSLLKNFQSVAPWIESEFGISSSEALSFVELARSEL